MALSKEQLNTLLSVFLDEHSGDDEQTKFVKLLNFFSQTSSERKATTLQWLSARKAVKQANHDAIDASALQKKAQLQTEMSEIDNLITAVNGGLTP